MVIRIPPCYVDAPGFGETITMVQTYNYTHTDSGGTTTLTGTATFTWNRVRLSESAPAPKSPVGDTNSVTVGKAQFLAVASAVGLMPGWLLTFGPQDTIPDAFTYTTILTGGTPTSSPFQAFASLSANTAYAAPGRPVFFTAQLLEFNGSGFTSSGIPCFNGAEGGGDASGNFPISVELVQPQRAATPTAAAVGPVYRVTIPLDCDLKGSFGGIEAPGEQAYVIYNGEKYPAPDENGVTGFYDIGQLPGQVFLRAANIADVMLNYGDTLASGMSTISYFNFVPSSTLQVQTYETYGSISISNPFPMRNQSFDFPNSIEGFSARVDF